jgi:hypothetical protein
MDVEDVDADGVESGSCQPEQLLENARQGLARLTIK